MIIDLNDYKAPVNETAVYKHIPIIALKAVQTALKGQGYRYIFRGPRVYRSDASTRKKDAWGFSVYYNGQ
jgi:hypothetical protein